jgi:hypothetical protein
LNSGLEIVFNQPETSIIALEIIDMRILHEGAQLPSSPIRGGKDELESKAMFQSWIEEQASLIPDIVTHRLIPFGGVWLQADFVTGMKFWGILSKPGWMCELPLPHRGRKGTFTRMWWMWKAEKAGCAHLLVHSSL